jgi:peptide chain release factor 1
MKDIIEALRGQFTNVETELSNPDLMKDMNKYLEVTREHSRLRKILDIGDKYLSLQTDIADNKEMAQDSDPEIAEMASEELPELEAAYEKSCGDLEVALLPHDPNDDRHVILEVRAGTGGDEAALFAEEVSRMYVRYAEKKGWKTELIDATPGTAGGMKEITYAIKGEGAFGILRWESGGHRVQRVPATESQGRIHTSLITVAVLPEAENVDLDIQEGDLRIDVYRASGPGGQSVNTTDSAVRITHEPTGVTVQCQDEKSQHKNKAKAMMVLRSRILEILIQEQDAERAAERKSMVGSGDRSGKIRTYNFPQSRLTDHRIGLTIHSLDAVMQGELDPVVEAILAHRREEALNENRNES